LREEAETLRLTKLKEEEDAAREAET